MLSSREQVIRERAYEIWEQEGHVHGRDVDHWLRAEAEITSLCIFGEGRLGLDTKPEHILLSCLGGRKTTTRVICSFHNNVFGNKFDDEVAEQVKFIRNMLQLESGTRKRPPAIRNVQAGGATINLRNDGQPELTGKPFTVLKMPDGSFEVSITARSEEHLRTLIFHIAAQVGCSEEQVRRSLISTEARRVSVRPGIIGQQMAFGGTCALRSFVKSCLVLWTTVVGNEHVRSTFYDDARRFVLEGDSNPNFKKHSVAMDSRILEREVMWAGKFGPLFNLLYVQSNNVGRVIGHFTLYNIVSWRVVLAETGGVPNQKIAIASNPLDPAVWSDMAADEYPIEFAWLDVRGAKPRASYGKLPSYRDIVQPKPRVSASSDGTSASCCTCVPEVLPLLRLDDPDYDLGRCNERISRVCEHYVHTGQLKAIGKIVDEVLDRFGLRENDPINPQDLEAIKNELTHRTGLMLLGLPHEVKMSVQELRAILMKGSTES